MALAVVVDYGGETVTAGETAVHISTTELPTNTDTGYDANNYPASPAIVYYFSAELSGQDTLTSQAFSPNGGAGYWEGLVFPAAGTWTIHARDVADDSSAVSTTVEVV